MSRFDPGKDWWDEELHKMSIELNKNVVRLELPEIDPAAKIMKDELWMTAKDLRIDVNGAVSAENNIDDGVEAVPACEVNLQQIQDSVDRSFVMLRHMHEAIDDLTRIITHRDVILRNTMDKWRNELDGTLSSVGKLRRSAFYQGTRVINVWKCYLAETKSELRGKRERQLMEALRKCRNIRAQCAHQSSFQYERQAREVATAFQRWHMEHHQLWSQLSSQVCSAFLQLPRIKKQHMLQLNKLTYNQYVLGTYPKAFQ